jgi:diguanylate cyclase (GGDEF)-like protein
MESENRLVNYMKELSILVNQAISAGRDGVLFENKIKETCSLVATMIDNKDAYQEGHTHRKAVYAEALAEKLGLDNAQRNTVQLATLLHDIGKLGIGDEILLKQGGLSPEELKTIKKHPLIGERILMPVGFSWNLLCAVRSHHEAIDGNGYPDGLKGEEIPVEARIIKIVDAFGAMIEDRPYRKALPVNIAIKELKEGRGKGFDGDMVDMFVQIVQEKSFSEIEEIIKDFPRTPRKKILVVDDDPFICEVIKTGLEKENFEVITASCGSEALRKTYYTLPDLVILDIMLPDMNGYEICKRLSLDPRTSGVPILVLTIRDISEEVIAFENGAVDFINKPFEFPSLLAHIQAHLKRFDQSKSFNPLTGMPGRTVIELELKKKLEKKDTSFALMCVDIDGFKGFNDYYGFLRGDSVIKLVAQILSESIKVCGDEKSFIGHNGGDDFVLIVNKDKADAICKEIISRFDTRIKELYHPADIERGYTIIRDREGRMNINPILTISIGVVFNTEKQHFKRPLDIFDAASQMMEYAKSLPNSTYYKDEGLIENIFFDNT